MAKAQAGSRAASRAGAAQAAPTAAAQTASKAPKAATAAPAPQPKPARAKSEKPARPGAAAEAAIDAKLAALFDAAPASAHDRRVIAVRGAREHNLKNVDLTIPRDKLVVFTGLSGSGKSSLAFDTIYAEGQRRYVESLSAYARQFLEMMSKPDVDQIDGLSPAISIEQKTTSKNPRSTVGTVTEIYDYMRLLWARVGIPYSPATGLPIES
ncbi:MAG: excinuclease ABC subunit A, partial [Methylobacterium sp.]